MRLVLDARFWRQATGGIGRYSRELLTELLGLGTDDEFHVLISPADEPEFTIDDARVTKHVTAIGHYSLAEQTQLPAFLHELKPDLVHFLNFNQPLLYSGKRVTTIHDLTIKYFPVGRSQRNPIRRLAFDAILRRAAQSDGVVAISRSTKVDIVRQLGADPGRIQVIYEAADERFRPQSASAVSAFRKRVGLAQPYILFVNQWRPHKGLPELIAAFDTLKEGHASPIQLVITGRPNAQFPELSRAIEHSRFRSDIHLPGFVADDDLPLYYAAAETLAFPSFYEGFGLGILEAMASGTPVVCTRTSSLPEVAGSAARYVEPHDVAALAQALGEVIQSPEIQASLRAAGLKQAAQFSWHETARKTYELYQSVTRS